MSKPDTVHPAMRDRLLANRYGRLTVNQWLDISTQPLVALLVLFIPLGFVLLPRLLMLTRFGGLWAILFLLAVLALSIVPRAFRYSRMPLHCAEMTADSAPPLWMFWRAPTFRDEERQEVQFGARLSPPFAPEHGKRYLVYYLKDGERHILLSAAPTDHPDAGRWQPKQSFHDRLQRRTGDAD